MQLKRLGIMFAVSLPLFVLYFAFRPGNEELGTMTDVMAAIAIGCAGALIAEYIMPREKEGDKRS
ncbi:MAG: hypothetical protein ACR2PM_19845 [Hyphomicrobiales bacterium]